MIKSFSKQISLLAIAATMLTSCNKPNKGITYDEPEIPNNAPNYAKSSNDNLAYLGRVLFYDKKLSYDNTVKCASCHQQSKAFADDAPLSQGVNGLTHRNAPSIVPKTGKMFWDGRAKDLNEMVLMPISNETEMNITDFDGLCTKLSKTNYYPTLFKRAFGDEKVTKERVRGAIAEFVRCFDFTNNKFKQSTLIVGKKDLSSKENSGKDLFFGKAKCAECHKIASLSSGSGGGYYGAELAQEHNIGLDYDSPDKGCGAIPTLSKNGQTQPDPTKNGCFMQPVLTNIELTAPYMHDGRYATLEEVVEHYNSKVILSPTLDWVLKDWSDYKDLAAAKTALDKNRDQIIDEKEAPGRQAQKLNLNDDEKSQIVAFLKTLTDNSIYSDKKFSDPFVR